MAKSKEQHLPAKKLKSQPAKTPVAKTSKSANLSTELVNDSDSDDGAPQTNRTASKVAGTKKTNHKANGTPVASTQKTPKRAAATSEDSEEDTDTTSASEESDGTPSPTLPKSSHGASANANGGVKRKAEQQSSSEEESSDGSSDGSDAPEIKRLKRTSSSEAGDSSEHSSQDDGGSLSGDDSEEDTGHGGKVTDHAALQPKAASSTSSAKPAHKPIPARQFHPPKGYTPLLSTTTNTSNSTLTSSKLAGKQVWHITAPAALSLDSLTTLAASALSSGEPVLTHNGTQYFLRSDEDDALAQPVSLLLPSPGDGNSSGNGSSYALAPQPVTHTLHIRAQLALPSFVRSEAQRQPSVQAADASAMIATPSVSSVRPQPKGLRMRYRPPGFGRGDAGVIGSASEDGDTEDGEDQGTRKAQKLQFPAVLGAHGLVTDTGATGPVKKKKKKDKHGKSGATVVQQEDSKARHKTTEAKKAKKAPINEQRPEAQDLDGEDVVMHNGISPVKATKKKKHKSSKDGDTLDAEEKRRRKEEKRARKAAKSTAGV